MFARNIPYRGSKNRRIGFDEWEEVAKYNYMNINARATPMRFIRCLEEEEAERE
jgi:hypothetical protein